MVYVAVIAAAVVYSLGSAFRLLTHHSAGMGSAVAKFLGRSERIHPGLGQPTFLMLEEEGWRVINIDTLDAAAASEAVVVMGRSLYIRWGLWYQLTETHTRHVSIAYQRDRTRQVPVLTRLDILSAIARENSWPVTASDREAFTTGTSSTTRILWLGVLGDLSILAAFAAIIFSLVKLRSEIRWGKPGHCTECDYDLTGLAANKCPECGAAVNPSKKI